jgi:hypothetical protein
MYVIVFDKDISVQEVCDLIDTDEIYLIQMHGCDNIMYTNISDKFDRSSIIEGLIYHDLITEDYSNLFYSTYVVVNGCLLKYPISFTHISSDQKLVGIEVDEARQKRIINRLIGYAIEENVYNGRFGTITFIAERVKPTHTIESIMTVTSSSLSHITDKTLYVREEKETQSSSVTKFTVIYKDSIYIQLMTDHLAKYEFKLPDGKSLQVVIDGSNAECPSIASIGFV